MKNGNLEEEETEFESLLEISSDEVVSYNQATI